MSALRVGHARVAARGAAVRGHCRTTTAIGYAGRMAASDAVPQCRRHCGAAGSPTAGSHRRQFGDSRGIRQRVVQPRTALRARRGDQQQSSRSDALLLQIRPAGKLMGNGTAGGSLDGPPRSFRPGATAAILGRLRALIEMGDGGQCRGAHPTRRVFFLIEAPFLQTASRPVICSKSCNGCQCASHIRSTPGREDLSILVGNAERDGHRVDR